MSSVPQMCRAREQNKPTGQHCQLLSVHYLITPITTENTKQSICGCVTKEVNRFNTIRLRGVTAQPKVRKECMPYHAMMSRGSWESQGEVGQFFMISHRPDNNQACICQLVLSFRSLPLQWDAMTRPNCNLVQQHDHHCKSF